MALIYQEGMLEPEEVSMTVIDVARQLNRAAMENTLFIALEDAFGDPVVFQVPTITKIKTPAA